MKLGLGGLPEADLDYVAVHVNSLAQSLEGSRILVTGASGFVGMWLTASLCHLRRVGILGNVDILVLARSSRRAASRFGPDIWDEINVIEADIRDQWTIAGPVTHAVHGATPSSLRSGSADSSTTLLTSVLGTQRLIEAITRVGGRTRVLNLSSGAVYGFQPEAMDAVPETWLGGPSPFDASTPYAEGKRASEALLEEAGRREQIIPIQARLFAFMGPGLPTDDSFAVGNFVGQAARGESVHVHGDGLAVRSYLNARDLAVWLLNLLVVAEPGRPYNVGSTHGYGLAHWAQICADVTGVPVVIGTHSIGNRRRYVPEVANSRQLGIHVGEHAPEDAIRSWIAWIQGQKTV